ncbi:MAG: chemotaxis protein CheD [Opitutaceae bacterium]|nr:chemotaxis protein CheD [Opitutaceae bacterium]
MPGSSTIASLFPQRVIIGVGELAASNDPSLTLSTYALGSCVGVVAFDAQVHVGGILHLMLPDSTIAPERAAAQPAMFADTGFPRLLRDLTGLQAAPHRLKLFLAGGASVLHGVDPFQIGERNLRAVRQLVQQNSLAVSGADLGGTVNRTVHLQIATGRVTWRLPDCRESTIMLD